MKKTLLTLVLATTVSLCATEDNHQQGNSKYGKIVWYELATPDVQGAKDFYGKLFGWEFIDHKKMGDTIIKSNNESFGSIWEIPEEQRDQVPPPKWLAYINVENIEQSVEIARQNGATIVKPIRKAGDIGFYAIIVDPSGARFALWQKIEK